MRRSELPIRGGIQAEAAGWPCVEAVVAAQSPPPCALWWRGDLSPESNKQGSAPTLWPGDTMVHVASWEEGDRDPALLTLPRQ